MIKASAGGGGKGMRIAWNDEETRFCIPLFFFFVTPSMSSISSTSHLLLHDLLCVLLK